MPKTIEMTDAEQTALVSVIGTLERKAAKGQYWKDRLAPLQDLFERIKAAKVGT